MYQPAQSDKSFLKAGTPNTLLRCALDRDEWWLRDDMEKGDRFKLQPPTIQQWLQDDKQINGIDTLKHANSLNDDNVL